MELKEGGPRRGKGKGKGKGKGGHALRRAVGGGEVC